MTREAREIDVGVEYGLYLRHVEAWLYTVPVDSFDEQHHDEVEQRFAASPEVPSQLEFLRRRLETVRRLAEQGWFLHDAARRRFLIPLRSRLVLPRRGQAPFPLLVIVHGMGAFLDSGNAVTPDNVVAHHAGYAYLQRAMAGLGIASVSVDVSAVHSADRGLDFDLRLQIMMGQLLWLRRLTGHQPLGGPTGSWCWMRTRTGSIVSLADGLDTSAAAPAGSPGARLQRLARHLRGQIDFSRVALLGHSRGANAVLLAPARLRTPGPSLAGRPGSPWVRSPMHHAILNQLAQAIELADDAVKVVLPVQPMGLSVPSVSDPLGAPNLLTVLVASTHDEDTSALALSVSDLVQGPRASLLVHGMSHGRFNAVWRARPQKRARLNATVACQAPVRMHGTARHEELLIGVVGATLKAALRGQPQELRLLTGEARLSMRVGIERRWAFGWPQGPDSRRVLDSRVTQIRRDIHHFRRSGGGPMFAHSHALEVFTLSKAPTASDHVDYPITAEDQLSTWTHLSVDLSKRYDPDVEAERVAEPLENFRFELLDSLRQRVGRPISATQMRVRPLRAFPARKARMDPTPGCVPDGHLSLQTHEVELADFLRRSRHQASDLARVRFFRLSFLPSAPRRTPEVFVWRGVALSRRRLPAGV